LPNQIYNLYEVLWQLRKGNVVKFWFQASLCCLLLQCPAAAAIDGVIINGTTGNPAAAVTIHLVEPGAGGMQTLAGVQSDRNGHFEIGNEVPHGRVALLQARYKGATYNIVLQPGVPTIGLHLSIYDSTAMPKTAKVAQHMVLIQPEANVIQIGETLLLENSTQLTFMDEAKGSIEFYVPPAFAGELSCTVKAPDGMPIQRSVEKTGEPNVYKVNYPLKPAETRFDLTYTVPAADTFAGRNLYADSPARLVTPPSVSLSGEGIESVGQEPASQAHIYNVQSSSYEVKLFKGGPTADDSGQPTTEETSARLYTKLPWVLGLTFGILTLGGCLLYRRNTECV
jgi:hypothetical protein